MAVVAVAAHAPAQTLPEPSDTGHSMLRVAMLGVLTAQPLVSMERARQICLELPVEPPNDRLDGPHGDSLISSHCEVTEFHTLANATPWSVARYRWTSLFTAEDSARGPAARDTVIENEAVLFESQQPGQVRAAWHSRIEIGNAAAYRSATPDVVPAAAGMWLLSVETCLNGTGGCGQEFLLRHADGRWFGIWQVWEDELPAGFSGRLAHGTHIDPHTLLGEAGFYGEHDPNCCPAQELRVTLALQGDSLTLVRQTVVKSP